MYKLGLEGAVEPGIKLPTFVGSQRKQGNSRKTSTFGSLTMLKSSLKDFEHCEISAVELLSFPDLLAY